MYSKNTHLSILESTKQSRTFNCMTEVVFSVVKHASINFFTVYSIHLNCFNKETKKTV